MKVLIEARSLSASMGVKTYIVNLLRELQRQQKHQYTVVYDHAKHIGTNAAMQEVVVPLHSPLQTSWWLQHQLPGVIARERPAVAHFTKADVPRLKKVPTVVSIYDVIPLFLPSSQKLLQRLYWPQAMARSARYSDHILTISDISKQDIIKYLQVAPEKITVTPLAADTQHFHPIAAPDVEAVTQKHGIQSPYILFVGTWEPRKNIPALLRAFAAQKNNIPHQLVLAGKKGWKYEAAVATLQELNLGDRVRVLDVVPYEDLPALYTGADVFVWPSVYEGWGLPVLEALACGTPVITSDGGSLPQVVGSAGVVVPFAQADVAARLDDDTFTRLLGEAMGRLANDTARKQVLRAAGPPQAATFNWAQVAEKTIRVYEQVVQL